MKQALVTGGTRGIGAGIVRALASAGYAVTACGLTDEECAAFSQTDHVTVCPLDVTDAARVSSVVGGLLSLDLLVNCAGVIQRGGKEFDIDAFRLTLEVNLVGTMRMCTASKPLLARNGGSIVNMASMLSFHGSPFVPGYAASKGGVAQLTKSLSAAWADDAIRVNAIAPGWIETELTKPLVEDAVRSAPILARTPMNRWGQPDDIGGAVVFLASDAARFITGTILPIDGGYLTL